MAEYLKLDIDLVALIGEDWEGMLRLIEEVALLYRYHEASGTLVMATTNEEGDVLKLYRAVIPEQRITLLFSEQVEPWRERWRWMDMSPDGRVVAVAMNRAPRGMGGGVQYMIWEEETLRYEERDAEIKLRYSEDDPNEQFFAVLHPDGAHAFHWMYGSQMLKLVHVPTGEVRMSRQLSTVYAMGISECGDRLLLSLRNSTFLSYRLPEMEPELSLTHSIGYDWWGPMGLGINHGGDVAMCFEGKDRNSYVDINHQVSDWDSHVVMWRKRADGTWRTEDAFHFTGDLKKLTADDPFAIKAVGPNLYFAAIVDYRNVFWLELPSGRHEVHALESGPGQQLAFGEDGSVLYLGGSTGEVRRLRFPVEPVEDRPAVVPLVLEEVGAGAVFEEEDWRGRWDADTGCLDLSGTSLQRLDFLDELPGLVSLVLDESDVLELPDLSGFARLRRLSLNESLVLDFSGLSSLKDLEDLSLRGCSVGDGAWLRGMTGLRRLDLGESSILNLEPLAGMTGLEWLSVAETYVNDLESLRGLHLRHIMLSKSAVDDLGPLAGMTSLEELIADYIELPEFVASPSWTGLRKLSIRRARVLPEALAALPDLEALDVERTDLTDFSFLRSMTRLRELNVEYTAFADLGLLSHLHGLESLNIWDTSAHHGLEHLASLPLRRLRIAAKGFLDISPLANLTGLRDLDIWVEKMAGVGDSLQKLQELERLQIAGGSSVKKAADLGFLRALPRLKSLELHLGPVKDIGPIAGLSELERLFISASAVEVWAPLAPLKRLKSLVWRYNSTERIDSDFLSGLEGLEHFETKLSFLKGMDFLSTMVNLRQLKIDMFPGYRLDFLRNMPRLQSLEMSNAMVCDSIEDLRHVPDLREFKFMNSVDPSPAFAMRRLRKLDIGYSNFSPDALGSLVALRELRISGYACTQLRTLPELTSLRKLTMSNFEAADLEGLERMAGLRELHLSGVKLERFPDLSPLKHLVTLRIEDGEVRDPSGLGGLRGLQELHLQYPHFGSFEWLGSLQELRELRISTVSHRAKDGDATDMDALFALKQLQKLSLTTHLIRRIPSWDFLRNVHYAWLDLSGKVELPHDRVEMPRMRDLRWDLGNSGDFEFLRGFTRLHELAVTSESFSDLRVVAGMRFLKDLKVARTSVYDLGPLRELRRLLELDISNTKVKSLEAVAALTALERLDFEGIKVPSYAPLATLRFLEWLDGTVPQDGDLSPLAGKLHLDTIMLNDGTVKSLEPLFPLIEGRILRALFMTSVEVSSLPKGLKFSRNGFVEVYLNWRKG